MILAAKRPLIMVGGAASRLDQHPNAQIRDLVQRTRIPFFTTQMGKGVVAEDSDLYMGTAALSEGDHVHEAVDKADWIIAVGHDTCEKPPFIMSEGGPKVIHIAHQPATFTQAYWPQLEVIGEIGASVAALADRLEGKLLNAGALLPLREEILALIGEGADDKSWPVTLDHVVHVVGKVMPEGSIVTLDNGLYKIPFARKYRTNHPNTLLLDNTLATMGAGVPSAIVAAMLNPGHRVMAVCGDGGFQMTGQELMTAVEQKLNLVVLILDNGGWGMIEAKQTAKGFPNYGVNFLNPDFVKLAEACGAKGTRVETLDDPVPALKAALKGGGVHVVAVPVDDSKYKRLLGGLRSPKAKPPSA
ncbi:acetolactate synthase-1/2/3 large subunit [Rhizobium laguerreae]|nr:acetolactate synthase-1/2/3 large subunit [Rhizobium laguerreae]